MPSKPAVKRTRTTRAVTINDDLAEQARRVGKLESPPIDSLSRVIDAALAEFIERRQKSARKK